MGGELTWKNPPAAGIPDVAWISGPRSGSFVVYILLKTNRI